MKLYTFPTLALALAAASVAAAQTAAPPASSQPSSQSGSSQPRAGQTGIGQPTTTQPTTTQPSTTQPSNAQPDTGASTTGQRPGQPTTGQPTGNPSPRTPATADELPRSQPGPGTITSDTPATPSPNAAPSPGPVPTNAAAYVSQAGASDLWEIESSRAVLAKSDRADVKRFAQMMIDHHGQSTQKVKAAAASARVTAAPPSLDANQRRMLDEIKAVDASAIDAVYIKHQRSAHDAALALHSGYAERGDNESLRRAARDIVPVVEAHRAELGRLASAR
jgi:putative membrane protein